MSTIRVLMALPKYPYPVFGGLERQSHALAKALVQREHVVYALSSRFAPKQRHVEVIDGVRVHRVRWINGRLARFLIFPFTLAWTLVKLRRSVDLVHLHDISWFGAFVTVVARVSGLPVVTKLPSFGDFGIPGMRRGLFGFLRILLLKRCAAVVAMTPESMFELASIGYPPDRILKVTNGIASLPPAVPQPQQSQPREVVVIFVGRLSPEKGLRDLMHAWAIVKSRTVREANLRLIGEGPQADELHALVSDLRIDSSVELVGHCGDVAGELSKADIFVLPSYAEGNSNAILEAMLAGLPIVATRVGGALIQVGTEGERYLIPAGDPQALGERLTELIERQDLRLRLGDAMRRRVHTIFSIERVAATYEKAYRLILAGKPEELGRINATLFAGN